MKTCCEGDCRQGRDCASQGRTHWEGCWREHSACAVAMIERLQAENAALRKALEVIADERERINVLMSGTDATLVALEKVK